MQQADFDPFCELLDGTCAMLSRGTYRPNPASSALFFRALQAHSLAVVRQALSDHIADPQRGRFVPTPADVIAQIEGLAADDGRPGAEEAWAIACRSTDEGDTIVWTQETAEAFGIAKAVLAAGDEVGARMAFREAYGRLVDAARARRVAVNWSASIGTDPARRQCAINAAVDAGRLGRDEQLQLMPPRGAMPLLTLVRKRGTPEAARAALIALKDRWLARGQVASDDAAQKQLTEAKKRATGAAVRRHLAAAGQQPVEGEA